MERDLPGPNRSLLPAVSRLENESSDNNPPFSPSFFQKGTSTEKKKKPRDHGRFFFCFLSASLATFFTSCVPTLEKGGERPSEVHFSGEKVTLEEKRRENCTKLDAAFRESVLCWELCVLGLHRKRRGCKNDRGYSSKGERSKGRISHHWLKSKLLVSYTIRPPPFYSKQNIHVRRERRE